MKLKKKTMTESQFNEEIRQYNYQINAFELKIEEAAYTPDLDGIEAAIDDLIDEYRWIHFHYELERDRERLQKLLYKKQELLKNMEYEQN